MMAPDWLKLRDGTLKEGLSPHTQFVMLGNRPAYRLDVRPARGRFTCDVTQTINGHRYDPATTFASESAALTGGLEKLREHLGW